MMVGIEFHIALERGLNRSTPETDKLSFQQKDFL